MRGGPLSWLALSLMVLGAAAQTQPADLPEFTAYTQREDLAAKGELAGAQRVLRFVQVSDAHILDDDAPYPMRQEALDPFITAFSTSAQRPQEEYTDEVLDSIVQAINTEHARDALQFVMNTGDNIDNDLENELMRFLDVYEGTRTATGPVSGLPCLPDGQSTSVEDADHDVTDACTSLPEALQPVGLAPGLPWFSAFGNHDAQIQGNANIEPSFQEIAAESGRRFVQQTEYVAMHFPGAQSCPGAPAGTPDDDFGHGYGFAAERLCDADPDNDGYYAFEAGGVRFLVLDTVNDDFVTSNGNWQGQFHPQSMTGADIIGGYAEGAVDPVQLAWLRAEVAANADKLLVVFSHHTVNSMFTNLAEGYCQDGLGCLGDLLSESGYATGQDLIEELSQSPNVVAWIGGHTHRHRIEPKTVEGAAGGFWNIESSSLIDWPQQARVVELWVTADGTKGFWLLRSFGHDFQPSKDLELTDDQRVPGAEGRPEDQDVLLWFGIPASIRLEPQPEAIPMVDLTLEVLPNAAVGEPLDVSVQVTDRQGRDLPDDLGLVWSLRLDGEAVDADGLPQTLVPDGSQGHARGTFVPSAPGHYDLSVQLRQFILVERDMATSRLLAEQDATVDVVESIVPDHGLPAPTLAWLALALGVAMLAARNKR